jgi:hypothetical protein
MPNTQPSVTQNAKPLKAAPEGTTFINRRIGALPTLDGQYRLSSKVNDQGCAFVPAGGIIVLCR